MTEYFVQKDLDEAKKLKTKTVHNVNKNWHLIFNFNSRKSGKKQSKNGIMELKRVDIKSPQIRPMWK